MDITTVRSPALPRFMLLYAAMYAAFGVASPFLPALVNARGLLHALEHPSRVRTLITALTTMGDPTGRRSPGTPRAAVLRGLGLAQRLWGWPTL